MCGIVAVMGELREEHVGRAAQRMLDAQIHRGPDDGGMTIIETGETKIALGNRRLAILDVSAQGHQPMINPGTGDTLVYNGEIYNSPQLRQALKAHGHSFQGGSDTEVLLRAYEHWGMDCLQHLKGMYAFALWDRVRRRLVIARDHLGIKPLYYSIFPGRGLVCASEVRALLASGLIQYEIDKAALAGYLAYGAVQEPLTIIRGVFSLTPGSWMEIDPQDYKTLQQSYWKIPEPTDSNARISVEDLAEEGRALLKASVKRHLLSDVPVGVFLSSGLDSTAVLKLANEVASSKLHAFTISTPDSPEIDEAPIAIQTTHGLDLVHHVFPVSPQTSLDWAQEGLEGLDQPAMDGLNTYIVSRVVKDAGIKVALSGQGGDEIFGGYRSFRAVPVWHRRLKWFRRLQPPLQNRLLSLVSTRLGSVATEKARDIATDALDISDLYFQHRRLLSQKDMASLGISAQALQLKKNYQLSGVNGYERLGTLDPIAMVGRLETSFYLRNTLLRDGDVMGMANSLEIRVPMLDKDLVEWAFRLPGPTLLPKGSPEKFLLRQMCADLYQASQTRQSKRGFSLPVAAWLLGPLRELMETCLGNLKNSGLLAPDGVDRVKDQFLNEPRTAAWSRVWGLVTFGHWLNRQPKSAS